MRYLHLLLAIILLFISPGINAQKPYREPHRPQIHFTPERNWMNDPNGLIYHKGHYHLFYQYNPYGLCWGHMNWGHAVSRDLLHWKHRPVAIPETDSLHMFSGSAVIDYDNVTGFGSKRCPPMLAFYTGTNKKTWNMDVRLAYSVNRGKTFTKYDGNPLIDPGSYKFGDPKVFWHSESKQWIMVNIMGDKQGNIVIYGSKNLIDWQVLSIYSNLNLKGMWECPELFPLPVNGDTSHVKWVMKINIPKQAYWLIGDFDGKTFTDNMPKHEPLVTTYGFFYASQTFNNIPEEDGRRILLAWIGWEPDSNRQWTGCQSLPRQLILIQDKGGYHLLQKPITELKQLKQKKDHILFLNLSVNNINRALQEHGFNSQCFEFEAEFKPPENSQWGINFWQSETDSSTVGYDAQGNELFIKHNDNDVLRVKTQAFNGLIKLHGFVDHSVVEIFVNDGRQVLISTAFPNPKNSKVSLYSGQDATKLKKLELWNLKSIW